MAVILGKDAETDELITLSDTERFSGLYILGKTGTGKSSLLVSLAIQDIQDINEERGLLFIDPHGDAIDDILKRMPKEQKKRVILLDPTDEDYAFGINPLRCADPQDRKERAQAFAQTKDVFLKLEALFGGSDERLGKLLSKYLQYILYPLIENPDSTLYDIKMMLTNKPFREHLLSNMKYNADAVRDFWHYQFDVLSRHDQYEELKSTFNRISLFDDEFIRDIISQPKPTIDFADIMGNKKIVLLKIPTSGLDEQGQSFIGMLFISQLLKTVFLRADMPEEERKPFAIYCDEFQNFATPDFAKFFAQTRKFKIMPVVAHQYRDFKPGDPVKSATLAVPNKVHFNLTKDDAGEFAIEVAKKPPMGRRRERELVISQYPVDDLLQGHVNPEIRQFVNQYLRPMQERTEDIKDEMEGRKLSRMGLQDQAAIYRLEAQTEGRGYSAASFTISIESLTKAREAIARSLSETNILQGLHFRSGSLKQATRTFNHFLTATMEGKIAPGQEEFADFLIEQTQNFSGISEKQKQILNLYIKLQYGDGVVPRVIPFALADAHGLFPKTIADIKQQFSEKERREQDDFLKKTWDDFHQKRRQAEAERQALEQRLRENIRNEIFSWELKREEFLGTALLIQTFIPLIEYQNVQEVLAPYLTARFASAWQSVLSQPVSWALEQIQALQEKNSLALEYFRQYNPEPGFGNSVRRRFRRSWLDRDACPSPTETLYAPSLLDAIKEFLKQHGDGAITAVVLLMTLRDPRKWRKGESVYDRSCESIHYPSYRRMYRHYWRYNALYLPTLVNHEPLEILLTLKNLAEIMQPHIKQEDHYKYYWYCPEYIEDRPERYHFTVDDKQFYEAREFNGELRWLQGLGRAGLGGEDSTELFYDEFRLINQKLEEDRNLLSQNRWWNNSENLVKTYLQNRAWDIAKYGKVVADRTFPQPTIKGAMLGQVAAMVEFMVKILQDETLRRDKKDMDEWIAYHEKEIQENFNKLFSNKIIPISALQPQVLSAKDREAAKTACFNELIKNEKEGSSAKALLVVIKEIVRLCELLRQPENHIKKPSGQYVEKEVPLRTVADMVNEMRGELTSLPNYTAYAKITQGENGNQRVAKIKTLKLRYVWPADERIASQIEQEILAQTYEDYCHKRETIEEKIRQRQRAWQRVLGEKPIPGRQVDIKPEKSVKTEETSPPLPTRRR